MKEYLRMRKTVVVSLLALALSVPAGPALAASGGAAVERAGHSLSAAKAKPAKPAKPARTQFVFEGTVVAADAAAGTMGFTVRGGRDKALRGDVLTVTVKSNTVIRRNGELVGVGDLLAGDRVNVKGVKTGTAYAAARIAATGKKAPGPVTPTPDPVTPTPDPVVTPAPEPTPTTTPAPSDSNPIFNV